MDLQLNFRYYLTNEVSSLTLLGARGRIGAEDVSSWKIFTSWVCGSIIASADAIATSFDVDVVSFPAGPIAFMPADSAKGVVGVHVDAGAG
ncbi:hypothetical protein NDU88_006658 [Pleurodeles waltl]|uniref:Uncharacterized protein n=1 Tax=Pleurodeles waltl TaxID=8319 RepID=A0AAV7NQZ2_PLEWA|nr:hypothetical protein NDU88_006658 [Pleurodeles waltl]